MVLQGANDFLEIANPTLLVSDMPLVNCLRRVIFGSPLVKGQLFIAIV